MKAKTTAELPIKPVEKLSTSREVSIGIKLRSLVDAMRPKQWTKNLLVFAGIIFSGNLFAPYLLWKVIFAFALFCALSATVYLVNDIFDLEKDRLHPKKCTRPLVAGIITPREAGFTAALLAIVSLSSSFWLNTLFGLTALSYLLLHLAYSLLLKNIVIIDALSVSLGFILRAVAGAVVISVKISPWLLICTAFLALFLVLGKRRQELVNLNSNASRHRPALQNYSLPLIDEMISMISSSTLVAYCLYTFFSETATRTKHVMMLTIPFVLFGIFRYSYLVHQENKGGSPEEILLQDKPLIVDICLWLILVILIFKLV